MAAHRWRAKIAGIPTGRSRTIDGVDIVEFRGDKIVRFHQSLDSAGFASLVKQGRPASVLSRPQGRRWTAFGMRMSARPSHAAIAASS